MDAEESSQIGNAESLLAEYWDNFRLFPSKLEAHIYRQPLVLIGIAVLPYLVFVVTMLIVDFSFQTDWELTLMSLREWQEIALVIGLILIIRPFQLWQSKVPVMFQWLLDTQRVNSRSGDTRISYLHYLERYQEALVNKHGRYICIAIGLLLVLCLNLVADIPQNILLWLNTGMQVEAIAVFIILIFGFSLWAYFVALAAWPMLVTGKYISKLPHDFEFNIQPKHPDMCGGLKPLGDFCFAMTLPIVIGGLVLALFGIGGALFGDFAVSIVDFNEIRPETILLANVSLFVVFLPMTAFSFFLPLWQTHCQMVKRKTEALDDYANQITRLEYLIPSHIDQDGELDKARIAKDKLEIMEAIRPSKSGYPIWPFERSILLKLFSPQLLASVGAVVDLLQTMVTAMKLR